ncbi:hypothetical protein C1645_745182 [Glomus cerebriforme]|uniref:HMG box domain-containing protein n=1 Tax=Glomus cerebriforme TaxID=658196 RepID=A0A397S961_9GLOM|nr:hypothetical protein C1645_745182 [Glomus cerebriforme]
MPKIKKNHNRIINSNNSKLNNETDIDDNNSNDIPNDIRPSFPPTLTIDDLIKDANTNHKRKTLPNAFIVYRMALMKEYRINNRKLPPMTKISKIAKNSWEMESNHVKNFYERLVIDAKSIYKQNNVRIVLDKHMMNDVKSEQVLSQRQLHTMNAERNNIQDFIGLPAENAIYIQNSVVDTENSDMIINSDQEYISMLEQVIDYMLNGTFIYV